MDAELVLERDAMGVVARAERTIRVHHELGHQEQGDALDAGGGVGQPGQHQMHDVVGHVVVAVGDEDLLAEDAVAAVGLRFGAGADQRQVGAGLRLGQVHGAGPFTGDHLLQIDGLEFVAGAGEQGFDGARGQQRAQGEGHVRRVGHLLDGDAQHVRQALAPEIGGQGHAVPARLAELFIGVLPAGRGLHPLRCQRAAFLVTGPVERGEHFAGESCGFLQDGIGHVGRRFLVAGQLADRRQAGKFVHDETHVLDGGAIVAHCFLLV